MAAACLGRCGANFSFRHSPVRLHVHEVVLVGRAEDAAVQCCSICVSSATSIRFLAGKLTLLVGSWGFSTRLVDGDHGGRCHGQKGQEEGRQNVDETSHDGGVEVSVRGSLSVGLEVEDEAETCAAVAEEKSRSGRVVVVGLLYHDASKEKRDSSSKREVICYPAWKV